MIKTGVKLMGIQPVMAIAYTIASDIFREEGVECVITSGLDGVHSRSSRHYSGLALDFRTRHLPTERHKPVRDKLASALGDEFDCVLESNHIHAEYDPKKY